jgi:hypothetical protein
MDSNSDPRTQREKALNQLKWIDLAGSLVIAGLLLVLLSDVGVLVYAIVILMAASALVSFFVFFPWLIRRG